MLSNDLYYIRYWLITTITILLNVTSVKCPPPPPSRIPRFVFIDWSPGNLIWLFCLFANGQIRRYILSSGERETSLQRWVLAANYYIHYRTLVTVKYWFRSSVFQTGDLQKLWWCRVYCRFSWRWPWPARPGSLGKCSFIVSRNDGVMNVMIGSFVLFQGAPIPHADGSSCAEGGRHGAAPAAPSLLRLWTHARTTLQLPWCESPISSSASSA